MSSYPRPLSELEREVLAWLLPLDREGYRKVGQKAFKSIVIGEGRWGQNDLVLGDVPLPIDLKAGMEPVVARGELMYPSGGVTVSVNEENGDGQIEFELGGPLQPGFTARWCYSYWRPGDSAPATGERVREISISEDRYTFAISPKHKTIWLHHHRTSFNQLLPITGYYESVLRTKPPAEKGQSIAPRSFFDQVDSYSDSELRAALLAYNDEARKFDASMIERPKVHKPTFWQFILSKFSR